MSTRVASAEILDFWRAAGRERWFRRDDSFDAEIRHRFLVAYEAAAAGSCAHWEQMADGSLALTIVLDQFPRNMFRGSARAFVADPQVRAVAERALARGFDAQIAGSERSFFYLPFMHSEALADQDRCVALFRALGNEDGLKYAEIHRDAIRRFGRFPHRNAALGRATTPEEQAFLDGGGFSA